MIAEFGPNE